MPRYIHSPGGGLFPSHKSYGEHLYSPRYMRVDARLLPNGVSVSFKGNEYPILYPDGVWSSVPEQTRVALRDNLAVMATMHLPLVFGEDHVTYGTGRPYLEPYLYMNFIKDIPSCTEIDGTDTAETIRRFYNTRYEFEHSDIVVPSPDPVDSPHRAIVGLSFGKDSLLTYAVADEIGLEPESVYVIEESMTYEQKHKTALAAEFKKEFGKELKTLIHDTGRLRDYDHLGLPQSELGWGLQTSEYVLELLPFAYYLHGKYLLFGNEQTASATYMSNDASGPWLVYPCFDQSHEWTVHLDQVSQAFSGRSVRTGSLIEPLMDMMIQRILVRRYPQYAKYQMSCFTIDEHGRDYRWCHHCSVCAKMYLMCVGGGVDPAMIGLREDMLASSKRHLFSLFGGKSDMPYLNSEAARDEQIFALYSAAKKGVRGDLIDEFRHSSHFKEAQAREDDLMKKFVRLYEPISLPRELRDQVMSIYREELALFEL
ncbi:MAG: hypothetical protein QXS20_01730 [Candidatus Thorarchaeota archaeon]